MQNLSRLAGWLPPPIRRTLSGIWLDLSGLPGRLRRHERWGEPWQALHNVGGGDFQRAGQELLAQLVAYAGLTSESDVLDIGCGSGRLAGPLDHFLLPKASYTGFDVSRRAITTCRRRFARRRPGFRFIEADVSNSEYRLNGRDQEDQYLFPAGDRSIDVSFAFSVFSHMRMASMAHYLNEASRVLRPGGRILFTAYVLTPERIDALADMDEGRRRFHPWRDGSMVMDPRSPERAIAHPLADIQKAIREAGLELDDDVRFGNWLGVADYGGAQDLFVAHKRDAGIHQP